MHEFVLSARTLRSEHGVTALDVAKRLIDYGFHAPTVYFPLVVPEALMIEPTETETKETLDAFADAMLAIAARGRRCSDRLKDAPHSQPVRRLDEVKAAKQVVVRHRFGEDELEPASASLVDGGRRSGEDSAATAPDLASTGVKPGKGEA